MFVWNPSVCLTVLYKHKQERGGCDIHHKKATVPVTGNFCPYQSVEAPCVSALCSCTIGSLDNRRGSWDSFSVTSPREDRERGAQNSDLCRHSTAPTNSKLMMTVNERSHANCESGSSVLVFDSNGSLPENAK